MERDEDTRGVESTSDFISQMLGDEEQGEAFGRAYLKADFLSSAVDALFYARRKAHLTQEQVAERLQTKQSAIARLEADTSGSISLKRYFEVALACGMVPLHIRLEPVVDVLAYTKTHPQTPPTPEAFDAWRAATGQHSSVYSYPANNIAGTTWVSGPMQLHLPFNTNAETRHGLTEQMRLWLEVPSVVFHAGSGSGKTTSLFQRVPTTYPSITQPLSNSVQPTPHSSLGIFGTGQSSGATLSEDRPGAKNIQEVAA